MKYVMAFLVAEMMLAVIFLLTTITVRVHYKRKRKDDMLMINLSAWFGLIRFQHEVSVIKLAEDMSGVIYRTETESPQEPIDQKNFKMNPKEMFQFHHRIYELFKHVHALHRILRRFLKKVRLYEWRWRSAIGTGDAAETGMLSGLGWGIKSNITLLISRYLSLRVVPKYDVKPLFQEKRLETELSCMFRIRVGHAILAGLRMLFNLRKRRDIKWQNTLFKA
jgi:hypothetical protein